jgi:hypothetical protein
VRAVKEFGSKIMVTLLKTCWISNPTEGNEGYAPVGVISIRKIVQIVRLFDGGTVLREITWLREIVRVCEIARLREIIMFGGSHVVRVVGEFVQMLMDHPPGLSPAFGPVIVPVRVDPLDPFPKAPGGGGVGL